MKYLILILSATLLFANCNTIKQTQKEEITEVMALPELTIQSDNEETAEVGIYQATNTRVHDLLHTKLDVKFDWEKQHLLGTAELTFKPYFYTVSKLVLDAKGFDIHKIGLTSTSSNGLIRSLYTARSNGGLFHMFQGSSLHARWQASYSVPEIRI